MQELFERVKRAGGADRLPCQVEGEPGTGKELVGRGIHAHSPRSEFPYIAVNCPTFSDLLFESEFFGCVKGAFTGALEDKPGFVEIAQGGTLCLDEVVELSHLSQPKLLRFLATGEFFRVGDRTLRRAHPRIICATNGSLSQLVKAGKFRQDLHDRLHGIYFRVPPLRERMEDLDLLVGKFLDEASRGGGRAVPKISSGAMTLLRAHPWPGNVRQLENLIHAVAALLEGDLIDIAELRREGFPPVEIGSGILPFPRTRVSRGKEEVERALAKHEENRRAAARELGIDPSTLYRLMKRYGIER